MKLFITSASEVELFNSVKNEGLSVLKSEYNCEGNVFKKLIIDSANVFKG